MLKTIHDVIKDIFKSASDVDLPDITWEELKDYVMQQNVFHTEMFENADGYGIDPPIVLMWKQFMLIAMMVKMNIRKQFSEKTELLIL